MDKRTLCEKCDSCPEVVLEGDNVRVGQTTIPKATWNGLVDSIKAGRLGRA